MKNVKNVFNIYGSDNSGGSEFHYGACWYYVLYNNTISDWIVLNRNIMSRVESGNHGSGRNTFNMVGVEEIDQGTQQTRQFILSKIEILLNTQKYYIQFFISLISL